MAVARYYRADKNEGGASFPGVPLRDIDDDEWELLPDWLKASIDASEIYQKSNPSPVRRSVPRAESEESE